MSNMAWGDDLRSQGRKSRDGWGDLLYLLVHFFKCMCYLWHVMKGCVTDYISDAPICASALVFPLRVNLSNQHDCRNHLPMHRLFHPMWHRIKLTVVAKSRSSCRQTAQIYDSSAFDRKETGRRCEWLFNTSNNNVHLDIHNYFHSVISIPN